MVTHKDEPTTIRFRSGGEAPLALLSGQMSKVEQAIVINRLILIHQLSLTLQTQLDQERLLRIMLSGITAGEALGFNQALVFLLDDQCEFLVGTLGVGPINEEECRHVWKNLSESGQTLDNFIEEFENLNKYQKTRLNLETQKIRWKVGEWDDLLTLTLNQKSCLHVTPDRYSDLVPAPVAELLQTGEMVTAPLVVTDKPLGLVIADNKFSGRPITDLDILLLSIVANQTTGVLSQIRLIDQLEEFQNQLEEKVLEAVAEKEEALVDMVRRGKLATVGEMAVTMAHEIRNPLTAVRGFAQRLHRKRNDPETVNEYSEIITSEVDRLNRVLGDVLDFARNVDVEFKPVDLNGLVRKAVTLLEEQFGKHQVLCEVELDSDIPTCYYDATQISQVIINLMRNGAQAMKEGGVLHVTTEKNGETIILSISDTGIGIEKEMLERIFEPFVTTKTRGTGLGLALAKRVLEEHGGNIEVESTLGEGSTFRVILPVREEPPRVGEVIESLDQAGSLVDHDDFFVSPHSSVVGETQGGSDGKDSGSG